MGIWGEKVCWVYLFVILLILHRNISYDTLGKLNQYKLQTLAHTVASKSCSWWARENRHSSHESPFSSSRHPSCMSSILPSHSSLPALFPPVFWPCHVSIGFDFVFLSESWSSTSLGRYGCFEYRASSVVSAYIYPWKWFSSLYKGHFLMNSSQHKLGMKNFYSWHYIFILYFPYPTHRLHVKINIAFCFVLIHFLENFHRYLFCNKN